MRTPQDALPSTCALLEQGRQSVLHPGAQLYVSLRNEVVADFALGEAQAGVAMQPDTLTLWLSSGKPLTVIAIAQLFERGRLTFEDPVSGYLPEFAQGGKESITLRHLLTHTAGFREADQLPENLGWDETIARICASPREPDWIPGAKAGYQLTSSWFILGELVRRLDGRSLNQYVREDILEPLSLNDSWLGLPRERARHYGDRMGRMYLSGRTEFRIHPLWNREEDFIACRPGSGARGPIRELGKLYETLLNIAASGEQQLRAEGGQKEPGTTLLRPETLRELVAPQRVGLFDHTFQHILDLGLGFILNSNRYGMETVPYGYGRHASERAFGHSGSQSSCAFADPEHHLVVAWHCNGQPGEPRHQKRAREINSAIYQDLHLV